MARLSLLAAVGAISLPLLAGTTSAGAASPRTTQAVGKQLAELKVSEPVFSDLFGWSVAVSGTTAVVGEYTGAQGAAYVFTKTASGWKQVAELEGSDSASDEFGWSVGISGKTAVVGARGGGGRAYVFTKKAAGWKQTAELKGADTVAGDQFGYSVAISGSIIVVGAPGSMSSSDLNAGRAYVFTKRAGYWTQVAKLKGSDTVVGDAFGYSVAVSGTTVVVGAPDYTIPTLTGRAYIYTETVGRWKQTAELNGAGPVTLEQFGGSVAISGTTAIVGAPGFLNNAGRVYLFNRQGATWTLLASLTEGDPVSGDYFGDSVAISGNIAVAGAEGDATNAGQAYVLTKKAGRWGEIGALEGSDTVAQDFLGRSVAISGTIAVVGASNHDANTGRAYVFEA
jgi:hypothetical protein